MVTKFAPLALVAFVAGLMLATPKVASANEGIIELYPVTGSTPRCWASSVLNANYQYNVSVSCRGLVYPNPGNPGQWIYTLWIYVPNPQGGGLLNKPSNYQRLGDLGIGRLVVNTAQQFNELIVTKENPGAKSPSKDVVMRGTVKQIAFLDGTPSPTPTPTAVPSASATPVPGQTQTPAANGNVVGKFAIVVVIILFIATIITVVAILVARSRFK